MSSPGKAVLYGFMIWLIVFAVAFAIFPIHNSWRSLFESIMPVAIVLATSTFAYLYLKKISKNVLRESLFCGCAVVRHQRADRFAADAFRPNGNAAD